MIKEYKTIQEVAGQLMLVGRVDGVKYNELCEIEYNGEIRKGKVAEIDGSNVIVQLFEDSAGINLVQSKVRFLGRSTELNVSADMLGRIFSGTGVPIDSSPEIIPEASLDINGITINPAARNCSSGFIQTGISAIDGLHAISIGNKVPIFSAPGLPHANLAAQIAQQAKFVDFEANETYSESNLAIVFAAIGTTFEEADFFITDFERTGVISRTAMFISLASDPASERILTPRTALTTAQFLAYKKNMHVLVIMTDMTNYAEALREVSAARKEIPGREGYPNYLCSDFASIYERAGYRLDTGGSVTIISVLTMPEDDKKYPLWDSIRYIADGYIMLSKAPHKKGCMPPIDIMASLSRRKAKSADGDITDRLISCYARGMAIKEKLLNFSRILKSSLSEADMLYAKFADDFESIYINQGFDEERTIKQTYDLGLKLLNQYINI